jgi:ABC-type bacteriocin/lantibiotic exporter with double-glycine peptidase domain
VLRRALKTGVLILCFGSILAAAEGPGVWLDVPFVKQEKGGCGAASLAMVMQYWHQQLRLPEDSNVDAVHIQQALFSPSAHGIYAADMERYLRENGFAEFAFTGAWDDLTHHLEKGRPLLVALKPGASLPLHYVVVVGVDPQGGFVLVNDAAQRKLLKEGRTQFERDWKAAGNWTLLALPKPAAH